MNIFEDTNPRALKDLLAEIDNRAAVLPNFQRDFVWEPGATQELIVSIANNYPAGSILRVRDPVGFFSAREFEGAPATGAKHTFLVLDGQQRLTSLYQAFYGVGEHRYYLDLTKVIEGEDFEDCIFYRRTSTKWALEHERFEAQAMDLILPLSVLKSGAGGFYQWIHAKQPKLTESQKQHVISELTQNESKKWVAVLDEYRFPVVTLSQDTKADALCTIFETLNRTGVKLSVFELLTARFWPHDINLRAMWDSALLAHPMIKDFEVDPYYVLQAISLASRTTPSCKRSDILDLKPEAIATWWSKVIDGLALGLEILRDDCKVMQSKWLPYQTMLPPLAAILARGGMPKTAIAGSRREMIKQWFWCAVFGQAYESAPNSQSARDVADFDAWFDGGPPAEVVKSLRFDPKALRDITPRQRSIYRATICLTSAKARDFHTQSEITAKLMTEQGIDDHHVFPSDYLQKVKGISSSRLRDCVLNRTLIDRTTNQIISNRPPSEYLGEIRATPGFPFDEVMSSHFLPTGPASALLNNDYEAFLIWRQNKIWEAIRSVTKVSNAIDPEGAIT
jgi:hypothetical protein